LLRIGKLIAGKTQAEFINLQGYPEEDGEVLRMLAARRVPAF
jgi:hypothetical protein